MSMFVASCLLLKWPFFYPPTLKQTLVLFGARRPSAEMSRLSGLLALLPLASALLSAPVTTRHLGRSFSPAGIQPAARAVSLPTRTPAAVFMRAAPPSTAAGRPCYQTQ